MIKQAEAEKNEQDPHTRAEVRRLDSEKMGFKDLGGLDGEFSKIESVMQVILEEMRRRNVKTVVDVGCGQGLFSRYFTDFSYTGIDKTGFIEGVNEQRFPQAKWIWNKKVQDYTPDEPFDAAWTHCFFCLSAIGEDEMRVIVQWLKQWTRWIFLNDTPRVDGVEWQKMLADAGFTLEAHGPCGVSHAQCPVVEVWRNMNFK
jgi:SAM-dependent methyltransferase